jgi:chromosomal replication initiation ATPase DnaA
VKHITPVERIGMAEARQLRMEHRLIRQDAEIKALRAAVSEMQAAMRDAMSRLVAAAEAPTRSAVVGASEAVPRARMAEIAASMAIATELTVADIRGPRRDRAVAWPRQQAMLMMHQAGYSLPMIGRFFKRDHTTILHGVRAAKSRLEGADK